MIAKRAIVIGSGNSIRCGDNNISASDLPIWKKLNGFFTIGINWCFKYYIPTVELYGDYKFYLAEKENLEKLPLVFGMQDGYYMRKFKKKWTELFYLNNNIYLLPNRKINIKNGQEIECHGINAWEKGFYSRYLSGILGINLAIALGCKEIFLLGFDATEIDGRTHFYQNEFNAYNKDEYGKEKTGVGKNTEGRYNTNVYNMNKNVNKKFEPFLIEKDIKFYNVSPESKITVFPKISYNEFYDKIKDDEKTSQDYYRYKLKSIYYEKYM